VGQRVSVLWSGGTRYEGVVASHDAAAGKHHVEYDDGERKSYRMGQKTFWLAGTRGADAFEPRDAKFRASPPDLAKALAAQDVAHAAAPSGELVGSTGGSTGSGVGAGGSSSVPGARVAASSISQVAVVPQLQGFAAEAAMASLSARLLRTPQLLAVLTGAPPAVHPAAAGEGGAAAEPVWSGVPAGVAARFLTDLLPALLALAGATPAPAKADAAAAAATTTAVATATPGEDPAPPLLALPGAIRALVASAVAEPLAWDDGLAHALSDASHLLTIMLTDDLSGGAPSGDAPGLRRSSRRGGPAGKHLDHVHHLVST